LEKHLVCYDGLRYNGHIMVATLTPAEAAAFLANPGIQLVDVRDASETASGSIAGAHLIPLDMLRADPDAALPDKAAKIVFVCAKGIRSITAAKLAERLGYEQVYNIEGGLNAWTKAGLPLAEAARAAA
jgi:rhodanese-related sulfurtransferase